MVSYGFGAGFMSFSGNDWKCALFLDKMKPIKDIYPKKRLEERIMFKQMMKKVAGVCSVCLSFALLIVANTNSSFLVHQEKAPDGIEAYSKIK